MILHLDLDAFFASVEQLKDPRLRGKPVAVGNGVVASPSYEARARGVVTAMPIHQAKRVCPELIVLDGRHEVYRCFTDAVWEILRREAPALETFLDEAFADFTGAEPAVGDFLELGRRLRREIRDDVGLPATIGLARNRMLAKLAAKSVKPDGLRLLLPEEEEPFLLSLPIGKIPGMGPKTVELFADMNVRTVRELREIPLATLQGMLGKVGAALYERARGRDSRPVRAREVPLSVSRETSLEQPTADRAWLESMLFYLLERACRAVRLQGLRARGLRVRIRYADGFENEGAVAFGPTAYDADLEPLARGLLSQLYTRRVTLRLVGVQLSRFEAEDGQLELFSDGSLERRTAALDAVRTRFGHGAVVTGRAIGLLNSLPKDAYGYVLRTPSLTK
jgi:DNA polymerase-4